MAAHNMLNGFVEEYPDSLDDEEYFQSIEGLNTWIRDIAEIIEAPIAASDQIPLESGVNSKPVPPLKGAAAGNLFGPIIGEGRQMYASGSGMDCAIHSFLTSVSSNFRRIKLSARNRIASHFRREIMPRLSDVQREIARQMRVGGNHIVDNLEEDFLSDDMGAVLATRFKIGILVIKKTYPFNFHFANEFQKDENGEEIYERNGNGRIIQQRVNAVNSRTGQVGHSMEPVKVPTNFERVVVHHSTMGHWTPIRFGNTYFVSRDDVIRARAHFYRAASIAENQYRAQDANNSNLASLAAAMNISVSELKMVKKQEEKNAKLAASAAFAKPATAAASIKPATAAAISAKPAAKVTSNTPWICPACTFENKASARECEMCGAKKPASSSLTNATPIPIPKAAPNAAPRAVPNAAPRAAPNAAKERLEAARRRATEELQARKVLQAPTAVTLNTKKNNAAKKENNSKKARSLASLAKLQAIIAKRNQGLAAMAAKSVPNLSNLSLNNKTRKNKTNAEKARELGLSVKNYYNLMAVQLMHNTKK